VVVRLQRKWCKLLSLVKNSVTGIICMKWNRVDLRIDQKCRGSEVTFASIGITMISSSGGRHVVLLKFSGFVHKP
jgi:hypothetical protein